MGTPCGSTNRSPPPAQQFLHPLTASARGAFGYPMSMADTTADAGNSAAGERLPLSLRALSRLPWSVLYAVTACLALIAHRVLRYRLSVVRANIAASFPELAPAARRALERRYYRGLGELLAEVVKAATLERAELLRRVSLPNLELLRAELDAGRSLLLVGAHHGNWEWMLLAVSAQLGHPVDAAYKPLHGARGERLMHAIRTRFGATLVPAKELLAHTLRRRGARARHGGGSGAGQQRAQVVDAVSRPADGFLHGTREDRAGGPSHRDVRSRGAHGAWPLPRGVPADHRDSSTEHAGCSYRALCEAGGGPGACEPGRVDLVAPALEAPPPALRGGRQRTRSGLGLSTASAIRGLHRVR